jgi:DNA repair exonuclease SbcCD ATPase subunit
VGTPGRGEQPADAIGVDGDKNTDGQVIMTARELEALLKESAQKALDASAVEIQALMDSKIEMESKFETVMNDMKRDNDEKMRTIGRIEARLEGETKQRQDVERQLHENMVEFESLQRAAAVLRQTSMRDDEDEKEARRLATIHDGKRGVVDDGASKRAMSASPQKPVSKRTKTDDVCVIDGDGHDGDDDKKTYSS